jgi:hypothetical protein
MVKVLLIFILVAILMEDGSSIRKTKEEIQEEEEVAKAVNATLAAEEEKKRKEEEDEAKKKKKKGESKVKVKEDDQPKKEKKDEDEALPCLNLTCPVIKPCQPCEEEDCPPCERCPEGQGCPPCKKCGACPPCGPCPVDNSTILEVDCPAPPACPRHPGLTLPAAMAVGAVTGILVTGIAATVGLILRYVPPIISGFLVLATVVILWYLCSQYPETARELGGRAANLLREAAVALGHRVMAAIQRHQEQVGVPMLKPNLLRMSSMFQKVCTEIFYVVEN